MSDDFDDFEAGEVADAERLDADIDATLAGRPGRGVDPTVLWLATATRTDPPPSVSIRIRREHARLERRRWRAIRYLAALLGYLFVSQGVGNIVSGDWVARGLGEEYSPHLTTESGFALIAVGVAVLAAVFSRRMLPVSVAVGAPLGVVFGVFGIGELGEFAAGAALHLTEGVVAVAFALAYWRFRRYGPGRFDEEGV